MPRGGKATGHGIGSRRWEARGRRTPPASARPLLSFGGATGLGGLATEYLEHRRIQHQAEGGLRTKAHHLRWFFEWCEERSIQQPAEVTRAVVERYQRWLFYYRKKDGRPLTVKVQRGRLISLCGYFKWLARQYLIAYNPAAELDLPRADIRLPRQVLTADEVEAVMLQPAVTRPEGLRDRAILEVLYSTGLRRMELIRLGIYDVDRSRGTVLVRLGKGRKDRVIPIGERALGWVERYLVEVRPRLARPPDDGTLFLSLFGEPLAAETLSRMARAYIDAADLGKRGACHLFRHTMATLMMDGGADVRFVQAMLGHSNLQTTSIYTHVAIQKLKQIYELSHPGAKLGRRERVDDDGGAQTANESPVAAREAVEADLAAEANEEIEVADQPAKQRSTKKARKAKRKAKSKTKRRREAPDPAEKGAP